MAVDPTIEQHGSAINLAAAADVKAGQLVYWDSANSRLAAADGDAMTSPAEYIVVRGRAKVNGDTVSVAKWAIISDADEAFTLTTGHLYNPIYLSTTAGGITQTRPTGVADLRQIVGHPLTATRAMIDLDTKLHEETVVGWPLEYTGAEGFGAVTTAGTPTAVALDSGTYEGWTLNAQNEYILFGFIIPENVIKLIKAPLLNAEEAATVRTITFTVASAVDDAAHDAVTADTSETTKDIMAASAADDIAFYDAAAAFDATNIIRPGAFVVCKVNAADTGTEAALIFGMYLVLLCH